MTERERRHFAAIAEAMQAEGDERRREAAARGGIEKVLEGLALGDAAPTTEAIERQLDERALGRAELHRRARRLGLIP